MPPKRPEEPEPPRKKDHPPRSVVQIQADLAADAAKNAPKGKGKKKKIVKKKK